MLRRLQTSRKSSLEDGASEGIRTLDTHVGNVMLYQAELRSLRELGRNASPVFEAFRRRSSLGEREHREAFGVRRIPPFLVGQAAWLQMAKHPKKRKSGGICRTLNASRLLLLFILPRVRGRERSSPGESQARQSRDRYRVLPRPNVAWRAAHRWRESRAA